uniref:RNA-directed DNA polymerase n=2 Tax=Globodera pallida TaxID=36090 RepID=A0A183CLG5_GLOPA
MEREGVGKVEKGRVIAQLSNLSSSPEEIEERTIIGSVGAAESVWEVDNTLLLDEALSTLKVGAAESVWEVDNTLLLDKALSTLKRNDENENEERWTIIEETMSKIVPAPEKDELLNLVREYRNIFAVSEGELSQTSLVSHQIETGNAKPVKSRVRPVPYAYREKVSGMVQDYIGRGIVRPSSSPWASPIVIVPKKDGALRFCVDYRGLNAVTVKDAFPLPNIDNTLLALGGKKVFSTLDFMSGYWQIKMEPGAIEKTAFATETGLYEFTVLPFGLTNAVATFQRFMTRLFDGFINEFAFIYIDDILIASETWEQHKEHLRRIFDRIQEAGLRLKVSKCRFAAEELPFLGHILTTDGIKMDAGKVEPVLNLPIPTSKKQLQSLLGFLAYYRKFIYGFGTTAAPLYQLLKKDTKFFIGDIEKEAIDVLKKKIVDDVVLHFPNFEAAKNEPSRQFVILTDASKIGVAAVLCQPDEKGNTRPIYFASRQCNRHESKYCPTELEALAVRFGTKKFAQFITMLPTRIFTDHRALVPMFKSKTETGNSRVDKWLMELNAKFILQVEYHPGKSNVIADVLSRSLALKCPEPPAEGEKAVVGLIRQLSADPAPVEEGNREAWARKTKEGELGFIYEFLTTKALPIEATEKQKLMASLHNFTILDGLLYRLESDGRTRLFVPQCFREKLIRERHSGICAGHMSGKKVFLQLAEQFFWPNRYSDCVKAAQQCRICAHTRKPRANEATNENRGNVRAIRARMP